MTRRNIITLLLPSLLFLTMAIGAFLFSEIHLRHREPDGSNEKKFEVFVDNVKSGKWQLTSDRWIEGMRRERAVAKAEREISDTLAQALRMWGWVGLLGFSFQIAVVFSVRAKCERP